MQDSNLKKDCTVFYKTKENRPKTGITKITFWGRKYFQVEAFTGSFEIKNPFGNYRHAQLYPNEQCYLDECEKTKILSELRECFAFTGAGQNLSLIQLRQINQVIEDGQNEIC